MSEEKRRVVYKRVKVSMPHCPVCKEQLSGNNSYALPYVCKCGTWVSSWEMPFEYEVIPTVDKRDVTNM